MHKLHGSWIVLFAVLTGCSAHPAAITPRTSAISQQTQTVAPTTQPSTAKEDLTLDQIQPVPVLKPSTSVRAGLPALEAVRLFAQARIAMLDGKRQDAVDLLRKAAALDPGSFTLHKMLGDIYQAEGDPQALGQWEDAAEAQPDHLDLQIDLGRQYAARGDFAKAITHLRLAQQTEDYRSDDPTAAAADFLLARALQEAGYDHAALATYERLLNRIENQEPILRRDPQTAALLSHPEPLALQIASLYDKHHQYEQALKVLRAAASRNPDDFDVLAQIVRDTAAIGKKNQAAAAAVDLVLRFHASPSALALLRETSGSDDAAIATLSELHRRNPDERSLICALIDTYSAHGQSSEARQLLESSSRKWPDDLRLLRRQVRVLRDGGMFDQAAKLLIESLSRRPDNYLEIVAMWELLSRPSAHGRLRPSDIDAVHVAPQAEAARLLLMGRSARIDRGENAERAIIRNAVNVRPVFAPGWREMLSLIWSEETRTTQQKKETSDALASDAQKAGSPALADEIRGQSALNQDNPGTAALAFSRAIREDDRSSELYLNFATALHLGKDDRGAQSVLVRLIEEHPLCEEAYLALFEIYRAQELNAQAARLLRTWLAADSDSVAAQRLHAKEAMDQRRTSDAQHLLLELLDEHPADPQVLAALQDLYTETSRLDDFTDLLSRRLSQQPWNFTLGEVLAEAYQQQHKTSDAIKVAKELRAHVSNDVDLLYTLSGLYSRLNADAQSEQVLIDLLKLDPSYPGANNDLGFLWADHGKNLGEAEDLIRKAVVAQPENPSFLDSLGWVLYKRGKFEEALDPLARAATPAEQADPIVLDHLGDAEYRVGHSDQAAQTWQRAAKRLAEMHDDTRDDYKELQTQLQHKQQELTAGKPVSVSPIAK